MAIVTNQLFTAGDDALVASMVYDDVTLAVQSVSYTMRSGTGEYRWNDVRAFDLTSGTHLVPIGQSRNLGTDMIGFSWGS